jgi:triphosphatase
MANEVELKLSIAKSDIPRLKRHPEIQAAQTSKPITRKLLSIYYDTPQLKLLDDNISLRLRCISGRWIQTIKGKGSVQSGLHQRMEIETNVASNQFDFSNIANTALSSTFNDELLNVLEPIFTTEVQRTEWLLNFDNGDQIELALDVGELIVGEEQEPICEIELELKQGHAGRLFEFALTLQQNIPLSIENVSKAQRGYRYYRHELPCIVKAMPTLLDRNMKTQSALKQIVWECLVHLQGNQDVVLHGDDIEGVHQMRIALRRLRSVLKVFSNIVSMQSWAKVIEELHWITNVLGCARDIDVFITQTLPPLQQQLQNQACLSSLANQCKQVQLKAYIGVREALSSQRYQRLMLTLCDWIENERWVDTSKVKSNVYEVAHKMLEKHYKQLKLKGKRLVNASPEDRHSTRIAAKKLRYTAEFFASLYPSKKTTKFIKYLSLLQDNLGIINDITITNNLLAKLLEHADDQEIEMAEHLLIGWNSYKLMHSTTNMKSTWDEFSEQKPFWH